MKRTHTCGDLTAKDIDKEVTLQGWVNTRRDHGGVIFIDLRDRWGLTQVVFDPQISKETHKIAEELRREYVVEVGGKVRNRPKGMENLRLKTGEIEVASTKLEILNKALTPPFEVDDRIETNEDVRLKYRYLDLRKPRMQSSLLVRHKVCKAVRDFFDKEGFIEVETPMLAKSTPEGARDYLVPSRVHPGKFFALPQSPQLFKQLLMVAGYDRYFQIAKCFRDEDLRADRQPEFTQIDVEMSFVQEEDIYDVMERMVAGIWKAALDVNLKTPFPRLKYNEAMDRFGTDKPDTRFGLELINVEDVVKKSNFEVFKSVISDKGIVRCINAKGCANFSRKDIEDLTALVAIYGARGLAWMKMGDSLESSVVKFFPEEAQKELIKRTGAEKGDLLLFIAGKPKVVYDSLAALRIELGKRLKIIDDKRWNFVWITDFPLLEWSEEEGRYMAMHHPFTSPKDEDLKNLDSEPAKVRAKAYDLALNGVELGGGSIRIHKREVQEKMFKALGIAGEEAEKKFGFLMGAFQYGAPPHGGIAFGLDRIIAILTGNESIREVIAFPKNKAAQSLMDDAPSETSPKQLKELHIELDLPKDS
ncbi:MAG: aspartate--tRNA ligase [Candidatus Altiarchaeota archaeon]|nr:aspartate--tRNA ligase [Candidatus Altiarchaeota archaeon]